MDRAFYVTSRFFPQSIREKVAVLLLSCGSAMSADYWLGRASVISAVVLVLASAVLYFTVQNFLTTMLILIVAILLFHLATYLTLFFRAESRGRAVEKVLPNLLQLTAANLNSGMTPFEAVKESSRPEFGILKYEIDRAIALSLSTMQFNEALMDMTKRVRSPAFKNVIELFIEGMRTGGPLATLLSDMAKDMMEDMDLRREIVTRSKSYVLFITFIVVVGAPLLSAVSIHFVRTIQTITSEVLTDMPEVENIGGITFGRLTLTPEFLSSISFWNMSITVLIASWLLAVIRHGKDKYLVQYLIFLMPLTLLMFYAFDYVIGMFL